MKFKAILAALCIPILVFVGCGSREDHVRKSIVRIEGEVPFSGKIVCTGFFIAPHTVLTAAHCVAPPLTVDGFEAIPLAVDKFEDLALLRVDKETKPALKFEDHPVFKGETLWGIGYAYGWNIAPIVDLKVIQPSEVVDEESAAGIITEGEGAPGMSGGPMVNINGDVVGVLQRAYPSNLGYGVGINQIKAFLENAGVPIDGR